MEMETTGSLHNGSPPYGMFKPATLKIGKCFMKFGKNETHSSQ
jgi:hypothetical protein